MPKIFESELIPNHLSQIDLLDLSNDLFERALDDEWFELGAITTNYEAQKNSQTRNFLSRQCFLLTNEDFVSLFDRLNSIGDSIGSLGRPIAALYSGTEEIETYQYDPFHYFKFPFSDKSAEPIVFELHFNSPNFLFINPDILLYLRLEEESPGQGIWIDPRRGLIALTHQKEKNSNLETVKIRSEYLRSYLRVRQSPLVMAVFREISLLEPSIEQQTSFVSNDEKIINSDKTAKVFIQNINRKAFARNQAFLQRRLHLWFKLDPPSLDLQDPWTDPPPFDIHTFTLTTRVGPVAPGRFGSFRNDSTSEFDGNESDYLEPVFFLQEALEKYEKADGFTVSDEGNVSCYPFWALRSTRIGNELLQIHIGEFSELPFHEWEYWRKYLIEPPSAERVLELRAIETLPSRINTLESSLLRLNECISNLATALSITVEEDFWKGSSDSLAGRQIKSFYPAYTSEDFFLLRATLTSTFMIEPLNKSAVNPILNRLNKSLRFTDETPPKPLGSRKLLQRLTLACFLIAEYECDLAVLPDLVFEAEGIKNNNDLDLQRELSEINSKIKQQFGALAFLYDLRIYGGIAHILDRPKCVNAVKEMGLPEKGWQLRHYLDLVSKIDLSINLISDHIKKATEVIFRNNPS